MAAYLYTHRSLVKRHGWVRAAATAAKPKEETQKEKKILRKKRKVIAWWEARCCGEADVPSKCNHLTSCRMEATERCSARYTATG